MPIHGMGMAYGGGWVKVCLAYQEDSGLLLGMWRCVCARDVSRALPEGYNILRKGEKQAALKRWKIACQVPVVVDHKKGVWEGLVPRPGKRAWFVRRPRSHIKTVRPSSSDIPLRDHPIAPSYPARPSSLARRDQPSLGDQPPQV